MQEQAGNSFLQRGRLLQARICADGECGGHLQEGRRHLCQVCHGLPPSYALPGQSWHHRSLWVWRSPDSQQVGSAVLLQLHNRHPDSSSSFQSCAVHVIVSAHLQLMSHCRNCYGPGYTVHTVAEHVRLSKLVHCMSCCQHCCTSHTLSTQAQRVTLCRWHSAKASISIVAAHIELSTLMQGTHC